MSASKRAHTSEYSPELLPPSSWSSKWAAVTTHLCRRPSSTSMQVWPSILWVSQCPGFFTCGYRKFVLVFQLFSCDFGVFVRGNDLMSFYSAILFPIPQFLYPFHYWWTLRLSSYLGCSEYMWTWGRIYLSHLGFSFSFDKYPKVELLDHVGVLFSFFEKQPYCFL